MKDAAHAPGGIMGGMLPDMPEGLKCAHLEARLLLLFFCSQLPAQGADSSAQAYHGKSQDRLRQRRWLHCVHLSAARDLACTQRLACVHRGRLSGTSCTL